MIEDEIRRIKNDYPKFNSNDKFPNDSFKKSGVSSNGSNIYEYKHSLQFEEFVEKNDNVFTMFGKRNGMVEWADESNLIERIVKKKDRILKHLRKRIKLV